MRDSDYLIAQVCRNGHIIGRSLESRDDTDQRFCDKCGAPTVTACDKCDTQVRGASRGGRRVGGVHRPPSYCHKCGGPYPWTEARLQAARELADDLDDLTPDERDTLKGSLDDLVADTPRTPLAATRFKKLVAKAGPVVADGLKQILVDVVSESAKRMIWG